MVVLEVLRTLWMLLDRRGRFQFTLLVVFQMTTGILEMGSVLAIFGFVRGLKIQADGGRGGPIASAVSRLLEQPPTQEQYVWLGGAGVLCFIIGKSVLSTIAQFAMNRFLMKRNSSLSVQLFEAYLYAPYRHLLPAEVPKIKERVTEVYKVFSSNFASAAQVVSDSMTIFLVGLLLMRVDPLLTVGCLAVFGGVGSATFWVLQRHLRDMGRVEKEARSAASRYLSDALGGIIEIRLRNAGEQFKKGYAKAIGKTAVLSRRVVALRRAPRSINEILLTLLIVGSVLYLTLRGESVEEAFPKLVLFGFSGLRLTGFMSRVNGGLQRLSQQRERTQKLKRYVLRAIPGLAEQAAERMGVYDQAPHSARESSPAMREIRMDHVHFSFGSSPVLTGVSLSIEQGSFVGFCGPSGGGKSTLVKLLLGMLEPDSGTVTCDGWNVHENLRRWHAHLGYVGQEPFLTSGTVKENVAFGQHPSHINEERVRAALRSAMALDFVSSLPDGLNTKISEGRILSGGQRQRIALARALYFDRSVIILDEATSALDNRTEAEVGKAIAGLRQQKTLISVAHRLGTIRGADVIHYVDEGRIIDSGSYDSLLESCSQFRALVEAGEARR